METTDIKMSKTSAAESNRRELDALWGTAPQVSMMGKSALLESDCISLQEEKKLCCCLQNDSLTETKTSALCEELIS